MQSKCIVLEGKTASTPDGSNAPEPIPILIRIDGGLSSSHTTQDNLLMLVVMFTNSNSTIIISLLDLQDELSYVGWVFK